MARWADDLTEEQERQLDQALSRLLAHKPAGWSAVRGDREIVLRPHDRETGKFGVTIHARGGLQASYYDRSQSGWIAFERFALGEAGVVELLAWAESRVETTGGRA